jgi:hypothetical protein
LITCIPKEGKPKHFLKNWGPITLLNVDFKIASACIANRIKPILKNINWIPKLHKCPFKQRYIAESAKCSTKTLSKLLTCFLSAVKTELQSYCGTSYSRSGVNQMGQKKGNLL